MANNEGKGNTTKTAEQKKYDKIIKQFEAMKALKEKAEEKNKTLEDKITEIELTKEAEVEIVEEIREWLPNDYVQIQNTVANLTLNGYGGKRISFNSRLFDTRRLLYADLENFVSENRSFFEAGYIYIKDTDLISQLGLETHLKTLNQKELDGFLEKDDDDIKKEFKLLNLASKEHLAQIVVRGFIRDEIDLNKFNIINKLHKDEFSPVSDLRRQGELFKDQIKQNQERHK